MQIKRFEAKDMQTALRLIKKELGSDAVILSARSLKKENKIIGRVKSVGVEVTAAVDGYHLPDNIMPLLSATALNSYRHNATRSLPSTPKRSSRQSVGSRIKTLYGRKRPHQAANTTRSGNDDFVTDVFQHLLSQEVKRDIAHLKRQGMFIMTRGTKHDMGPGLSHKTIIIDLYFNGYTFSEIEQKTNHSETSVKRYLADFVQVATLYKQHFSNQQIRIIAKKSDRIVREYIQLYQTFSKQNNERLNQLLTPAKPGDDAKKKSTSQSVSGGTKNE